MLAFQKAQRHSAEKQRQYVEQAKTALSDAQDSTSNASLTPRADSQLVELTEQRSPPQELQQQQLQEAAVSGADLEFQETLIEEREGEIREIEAGILELNEIFRDLGTIVHEQQSMLDNIESNVINIANDTAGASTELTKAHEYQRRAGRRMLCLLLIFVFVLTVVLLAVRRHSSSLTLADTALSFLIVLFAMLHHPKIRSSPSPLAVIGAVAAAV